MDRDEIDHHLVIAGQHVADGARHIEHQLRIIKDLQSGGHDTTQARQILETMKKGQAMHEEERSRLTALLRS